MGALSLTAAVTPPTASVNIYSNNALKGSASSIVFSNPTDIRVSGGVAVINPGGSGGGGSATNAMGTVRSNNVVVGTGLTSLESTNPGNHIDIRWSTNGSGKAFFWAVLNATATNGFNAALNTPQLKNMTNLPSYGFTNVLIANLAGNPYVAYTNVATKTSSTVSGAGNGNTNYLLTLSTNALNDFYLGSSNVHLYTVAGSTLGSPIYWSAFVTNLSADTWGINFSSGTNRWRFAGDYGTNAPTVLSNNTCLLLSGRTDGSNTVVGYTWFKPAL